MLFGATILLVAALGYREWTAHRREVEAGWLLFEQARHRNSGVELRSTPATPPPLPVPRSSQYLNTWPAAQYIGSERCRECHEGEHASYLQTAHSRSFNRVDPERQPPDGTFDHELSRRRLRAYRAGAQLRHSESLLLTDGGELALVDRPLVYLVGSGQFARTYLTEIDGFLIESPLTWYASPKAWRMSPGYDVPRHSSFQRNIDADCLDCHAGRAESIGGSASRLAIHELAIGCERCHGPGSIHASRRETDGGPAASQDDLSIVNPRRLPRELAEAVCYQCHLESATSVVVRGRKRAEFRPGLAWNDFVANYSYETPSAKLTVTGHVEQMRASRCYQASDSLTCITCHDPHHAPQPEDRRQHYRAACLACHNEAACGAAPALRRQRSDDCTACHMPKSAVDVPHLAFTHHRIAVHAQPAPAADDKPVATALVPVLDAPRLSEIEQRRLLGLAYQRHHLQSDDARLPTARQRASELLKQVAQEGLHDGAVAAALAALALEEGDVSRARHEAERALASDRLAPGDQLLASELLAALDVNDNRLDEASRLLHGLIDLRLHPQYWFLLGVCRERQQDARGAIQAFERVLAIDPAEPATYRMLVPLYQALGDVESARRSLQRAQLIEENLPQ